MNARAIVVLTAALAVVAISTAAATAQGSNTPERNRRVWYGSMDAREVAFNLHDETPSHRPVRFFSDVRAGFLYVSVDDPDHPSGMRWISRRLWWEARGSSASSITGVDCVGKGNLDLGPAQEYGQLTTAQEKQLRIPCEYWDKAINWALIRLPNPNVPMPEIDTHLPTCGPERRWTSNGVRYSLGVAGGDPQGAFRVENLDKTPTPGAKYKIVGWSNVLGRWRFVVETSRLRGYATNADIDPLFYWLHPQLQHLRDRYRTLDPDLIFDPTLAEEDRSEWKPPYPDSGRRKWTVLESAADTSVNRVEAELTAMDYGAHGEVRAYLSPSCGDGSTPDRWLPVQVEHRGDTLVKVPTDDDGNFIADSGHTYDNVLRGVPSLADDDGEPKGDGTPGDGFTAFEEYRGFLLAEGCEGTPPLTAHRRTDPRKKDLFIRPSNTLLGDLRWDFELVSGLTVHPICGPQYSDDHTRIVNFTMHSISGPSNLGEGLRGARLTQARPQHGLYLVEQSLTNGVLGESFGFGPPGNVSRVAIDFRAIANLYGRDTQRYLTLIGVHELGHAVGMRHHGDMNIVGPIVLLTTPGCIVGMTEGTVDGRPACLAEGLAMRGQQNSGNARCPMKYIQWRWYVPRGSSLTPSHTVDFRRDTPSGWRRPSQRLVGYHGIVERYRKDLDGPPSPNEMKFCIVQTGTGINALPLDQNHAGDASRSPCAGHLRVNDVPTGSQSGQ